MIRLYSLNGWILRHVDYFLLKLLPKKNIKLNPQSLFWSSEATNIPKHMQTQEMQHSWVFLEQNQKTSATWQGNPRRNKPK